MPSRTFTDSAGRSWIAWDVHPGQASGRAASALPDPYRFGWLAFKCGTLKRRLAPIPANWLLLDDAALATCCDCAIETEPPSAAPDDIASQRT